MHGIVPFMAVVLGIVILTLTCMLVGTTWVIFKLLKRLDTANQVIISSADRAFVMAEKSAGNVPKMQDRMFASLTSSIQQIHESVKLTVAAVLSPPVVAPSDDLPGGPKGYVMPTMNEGKEPAPWDPTDRIIPDTRYRPPNMDMGYEHEAEEDFDPNNPFGIPGLTGPIQEVGVE